MIFSLRVRSCTYRVGFYMIPYIQAHIFSIGSANARKQHRLTQERISSSTRLPPMWWALDGMSLIPIHMIKYHCTNSYPVISFLIWFLPAGWDGESTNLPDDMVNLWIFTLGLTSAGCRPHTSNIWPWSGTPKVRLYDTFLGSLRHSPLRMKNQHGLNEEKKPYR